MDAERGVTVLYHEHYAALVRLAGFLVRDLATAEAIVQDAFVAVHAAWRTLPDSAAALGHLHRSVVAASRAAPPPEGGPWSGGRSRPDSGSRPDSKPRLENGSRLENGWRPDTGSRPDGGSRPDAEAHAGGGPHGPAIIAALTRLPARQREAVVLQHYAGLPAGQIAAVMGIHEDAVQRLAARAGAALHRALNP